MAQRVLRDVEVVARAGLDVDTFLDEALASVARAVPHVAACIATVDPSTHLLTGTFKFGDLHGRDEHDHEFGLQEYGVAEPTAFTSLARGSRPAVGMHDLLDGEVERSPRMADFMRPLFGFSDELRVIVRDRGEVWGGAALFRAADEQPFDASDVELLGALSPVLAVGMRAGLVGRLAGGTPPPVAGPAVIIVGSDGAVRQMSAGAEDRLADLLGSAAMTSPVGVVGSLVGAARRFAAGRQAAPPRCRVRSRSGMWLVLHASPLSPRRGSGGAGDLGTGGDGGDVVVTIDEARPPEIVPLVVAAFELTPRERDVTALVLQGVDTKEIAAALHLSAYTVQDHLKAVFDKAGVRSRRELIARIYFDQYVPRMGTEIGPTGWFAGL